MKSKLKYLSLTKRILSYLRPFKKRLFFTVLLILISNFSVLIGPYLSGKAIDAIGVKFMNVDFNTVIYYCLLMIFFYAASGILSYVVSISMLKIGKETANQMRKEIQAHLLKLPVSYFDTKQTGDIISNISYDVETLNTSLTNDILQIITSIITLVFSFCMMLYLSPIMIPVFLLTVPLTVKVAKFRLIKTKPLYHERSKKLGELNGYAEDILSGLKTIKAYHQEKTINHQFSEKNNEASNAYYEADYQGGILGPLTTFLNNFSLALLGILGSILYILKKLSIGNLSAFILYSRKFVGPINELANIMGELQSSFSAANRIFSLLDESPEIKDNPDAIDLTDAKGSVSFSHVNFGYSKDHPVLLDLSLDAPCGSTIAIVGPTGAGKSTIINLLMRFYDPLDGTIKIDGIDTKNITRKSLRKAFSMVLQETWIFEGTIFENIAYGTKNASLAQVKKAAREARIDSFIESLPNGYDTIITDDGSNLSKGQKQLITIARAMLSDTSMLILDEATSNVDSRTELLIQKAMLSLMQNKTCFVIAHRLSTIQNADCILVLKDGNIVEQGTHEELMKQGKFYYNLYQSQFE